MYFLQRFSSFLNSIIQAAGMLFLFWQPKFFYERFELKGIVITVLLLMAISFISSVLLVGKGVKIKQKIHFGSFLLLSWASIITVFLFNDLNSISLWLIFVLPLLHGIWLETLFFFWQQPISYQPYTLQKLANYLYLVAIFFAVVALTGLMIYMQWPFYLIWVLLGLLFWIINFDLLILQAFEKQEAAIISAIGSVIGMQIYLVAHLLPGNFFLYAVLVALFFYLWFGIIKAYQQKRWQRKMIYSYISISSAGIIAALFTTFWIR